MAKPILTYEMSKQSVTAGVLLCLVCVAGLTSCSQGYNGPFVRIPQAALNPPLYPGAQQVKATPKTFYSYDANWQNRRDRTVTGVTFLTPDKVDTVFAFYKDILSKEGWESRTPDIEPEAAEVIFDWKEGGCPEYFFEVTVSTNPNNTLTQVQLAPMQYTCID
ncbi:MAG: hypothetical protein QOH93_2825 [Chloroflexia bacterium]|jgi:hypothetical protein|nr:hypothetical protein [Chloroflexia bacterium]